MIALGVLQLVTGLGLGGVWLALIGWFVVGAETAKSSRPRWTASLAGFAVGQAMTGGPPSSTPTSLVEEFIARVALTQPFSTYPLVDLQGRLTGLVTLNRVRAVPPELRPPPDAGDRLCAGGGS